MRKYTRLFINLICVLLLILALKSQPYNYYILLRWTVFLVGMYNIYISFQNEDNIYVFLFALIVIIFNPVLPFYLKRSVWQVIDIIAAGIFLIRSFNFKE
jgi:hypothetical protein